MDMITTFDKYSDGHLDQLIDIIDPYYHMNYQTNHDRYSIYIYMSSKLLLKNYDNMYDILTELKKYNSSLYNIIISTINITKIEKQKIDQDDILFIIQYFLSKKYKISNIKNNSIKQQKKDKYIDFLTIIKNNYESVYYKIIDEYIDFFKNCINTITDKLKLLITKKKSIENTINMLNSNLSLENYPDSLRLLDILFEYKNINIIPWNIYKLIIQNININLTDNNIRLIIYEFKNIYSDLFNLADFNFKRILCITLDKYAFINNMNIKNRSKFSSDAYKYIYTLDKKEKLYDTIYRNYISYNNNDNLLYEYLEQKINEPGYIFSFGDIHDMMFLYQRKDQYDKYYAIYLRYIKDIISDSLKSSISSIILMHLKYISIIGNYDNIDHLIELYEKNKSNMRQGRVVCIDGVISKYNECIENLRSNNFDVVHSYDINDKKLIKDDDDKILCIICLDNIDNNNLVLVSCNKCNRYVGHLNCFIKWIKNKNKFTCSYCNYNS